MAFQVITCPQTAQPETIEFELTPFGMVVAACTRLALDSTLVCPRDCVRQKRCATRTLPCVIELQSLMSRKH